MKLLVPVVLCLCLVGCGKENPIVGKWRLVSPKKAGGVLEMMLNNDGTATRVFRPTDPTMGSSEEGGKYTFKDGHMTINWQATRGGKAIEVKGDLVEGALTLQSPDGSQVYEK